MRLDDLHREAFLIQRDMKEEGPDPHGRAYRRALRLIEKTVQTELRRIERYEWATRKLARPDYPLVPLNAKDELDILRFYGVSDPPRDAA